jgi:predicted hydrocarbon binding protein
MQLLKEIGMNIIQKTFMKMAAKGFRPMMKNTYFVMGDLCKACYEKNGKEALPIIAEVASKGGAKQATIIRNMMPVKDMKGIGDLFAMMNTVMEMGLQVVEISENRIHFKNPGCILGLEGTNRELCDAMMNMDRNMMSTLLGREVETNIVKSVAAGDKECEVIFSIK